MEKQKSLLIKTSDPKISYGFRVHCNLCTLSGFCLFCNSNCMKSPFLDVFDELLFLYASLFSPKCVSLSHYRTNTHRVGVLNSPNQISSNWILNRGQDDVKCRYLINKSSKDSMHNTESFSPDAKSNCQI